MNSTLKRTLLGISGLLFFACGIAQAQTTIRMEAEDMMLDTYKVEVLDFASNGALINLKGYGYVGSATAPFPGASGNYDINVVYHDENDGLAQLSVLIDGTTVDSWTLDFKSTESQPKPANRLTREIATGYAVSNGDEIRIDGLQGNWDHANVDYIEFTAGGPDPDVHPPIVLDFSEGDVIIDEPGYYVLDRDSVLSDYDEWEVRANDVTIDFRGYTLDTECCKSRIEIFGDRITLKNGTISGGADNVGFGGDVLITNMRLTENFYFGMGGEGCRLRNSIVEVDLVVDHCIVQSNRLRSVDMGSGVNLLNNIISGSVESNGNNSVIARNTMMLGRGPIGYGPIVFWYDNNQILDNLIIPQTTGDQAIVIHGTGNILRGNILRANPDPAIEKYNYGIVFTKDGNYYGDNLISAQVPFELGGTTQVDLGGNQGL